MLNPLVVFCHELRLQTDLRFSMRFMSVYNSNALFTFGRSLLLGQFSPALSLYLLYSFSVFILDCCFKYSLGILVTMLCGWHNLKFTILLMFIYIFMRKCRKNCIVHTTCNGRLFGLQQISSIFCCCCCWPLH